MSSSFEPSVKMKALVSQKVTLQLTFHLTPFYLRQPLKIGAKASLKLPARFLAFHVLLHLRILKANLSLILILGMEFEKL